MSRHMGDPKKRDDIVAAMQKIQDRIFGAKGPFTHKEFEQEVARLNDEIQGWVSRIGASFPPEFLKALSDLDHTVRGWTGE